MSLQIQLNAVNILGAFQKVGLFQGQAYQDQQIFEGLDKLSCQYYDRDVAKQLFEQCSPNQRGQVMLEEFSKKVIEADKILKKKIQQTEQLIVQHQEEAKECQRSIQEAQYTSQKNQHGIERDSTLNLIIQKAERIQSSDFLNSVVLVAVDNSEQTVQQQGGDKANPIYNNQITFQIQTGKENVIVSLFIQDRNSKKNLVGQQRIELKQLSDQQVQSLSLQLQNERSLTPTVLQIDAQWIYDKLKYYQEMVVKYEQLIQQSYLDIEDYKRDLFTVQQPYIDQNQRNNLQSSIKPINSSKVSPQTNNALQYQQQQGQQYSQQQQTFSLQQQDQMIQIKNQYNQQQQPAYQQQQQQGQEEEISDELYYGFILYCLLMILSLFQCFARPAYLDIMLGMLYLLIVCRDCFNTEYIKFVGGFTIGTVILDIVWIAIYKNWWSGTDLTLPTWGTAGDPIVRITIVFCIFSMILKTALCYILFHYYKAAQTNQQVKFSFQQLEFQVGQIKQNLFTLDKQLLA